MMSGAHCHPECGTTDKWSGDPFWCMRNGCPNARFLVKGARGWLYWLQLDSHRNVGQHDVGWTDQRGDAIRFSAERASALASYLDADIDELPEVP